MKIITQLFKEFWIPLLLSLIWTAYGLVDQPYQTWDGPKIVNGVFVTFFGLSFWFGQWNRVKKQLRVEEGLTGIESKVATMLDRLDEKTNHLIGHITGGDGYCAVVGLGASLAALCNFRPYTLFEVRATLIDLDLMAKNSQVTDPNSLYMGQTVEIGTLHSVTSSLFSSRSGISFELVNRPCSCGMKTVEKRSVRQRSDRVVSYDYIGNSV